MCCSAWNFEKTQRWTVHETSIFKKGWWYIMKISLVSHENTKPTDQAASTVDHIYWPYWYFLNFLKYHLLTKIPEDNGYSSKYINQYSKGAPRIAPQSWPPRRDSLRNSPISPIVPSQRKQLGNSFDVISKTVWVFKRNSWQKNSQKPCHKVSATAPQGLLRPRWQTLISSFVLGTKPVWQVLS